VCRCGFWCLLQRRVSGDSNCVDDEMRRARLAPPDRVLLFNLQPIVHDGGCRCNIVQFARLMTALHAIQTVGLAP
jgi:hypothetical protein